MFSADLIPCTLTFPLISLARVAPARARVILTATAAFATIFARLMTFLSYLMCVRFHFRARSLEDVVDSGDKSIGTEEFDPCHGIRIGLFPMPLVFGHDFDVGSNKQLET